MRLLFSVLITLVLISCKERIMMTDQPRTRLFFDQLPDSVKSSYLTLLRYEDSIKSYGKVDTLINIDQSTKNITYRTKKFSMVISEYIFTIDNHDLVLPYESDIRGPYVFLGDALYFKVTRNTTREIELKEAEFGKLDLRNILQK